MAIETGKSGLLLGLALGALAGAIGVWRMNKVTAFLQKHQGAKASRREQHAQVEGKSVPTLAAEKITRALPVRLNDRSQEKAAMAVHYAMGILPAALYGVMQHRLNRTGPRAGVLFGTGLFLIGDEWLTCKLGLASRPSAYPWQTHARGLAGHLVYGLYTDSTFRLLRQLTTRRTPARA